MADGLVLSRIKFWCLLLLAVVAAHALLPFPVLEAGSSGSAFNPATLDVSTGSDARAETRRLVIGRNDADEDRLTNTKVMAAVVVATVMVLLLRLPVRLSAVYRPLTFTPRRRGRATPPPSRAPPEN